MEEDMEPELQNKQFAQLYSVITRLRSPGGCPWDRKQTPASLKKYLLEETSELADSLGGNEHDHTCEELGDLFFILLLFVRMYEEKGNFTLEDVLTGITAKMIRRHPHVFAGQETGTETELKEQWEAIKAVEKRRMNDT